MVDTISKINTISSAVITGSGGQFQAVATETSTVVNIAAGALTGGISAAQAQIIAQDLIEQDNAQHDDVEYDGLFEDLPPLPQ